MPPTLAVIIPAHNEEGRLPTTLARVMSFLQRQTYDSEVIVVENGSSDGTWQIAQEFMARFPALRAVREEEAGKGLAIRRGMLETKAEFRFICDADLSMPIEEVGRFLPPGLEEFDIAIGSREVPGAARYGEPIHRHLIGRVFNWLVRLLAVPGIQDTQAGFKCFRAHAAEDLFRLDLLKGWTFDVEVLFAARQRGYRIVEVPIPWYYYPGSRVSIVRDSWVMFSDLFRIRYNAIRGKYR